MKQPELPALTGIRFFAASLVFVAHVAYLPGKGWFHPGFNPGNLGVAIFFVLSGFILTYNYSPLFGQGINFGSYRRFIWDRLAKIYPLYLLTLLLAIPIELIGNHREWSYGSLIIQVTLLQSILPFNHLSATDHFNVPGWSISCEMFFYLLTPLLILLGSSIKRLASIIILGWLTAFAVAVTSGMWAFDVSFWPARFAPARTAEFIVGVVTAVCFLRWRSPSKFLIRSCIVGGLILIVLSARFPSPAACLSLGFLTAPGAALLLYGLAFSQGIFARFLSSRLLVLLGSASYAFYLIHDLIIRVFKGFLAYCHFSIDSFWLAAFIAATLFILVQMLSIGLFKMVEIPSQRYLRGLFRKPIHQARASSIQATESSDHRP